VAPPSLLERKKNGQEHGRGNGVARELRPSRPARRPHNSVVWACGGARRPVGRRRGGPGRAATARVRSASVSLGEEGGEAQHGRHDAACHGPSGTLHIHHERTRALMGQPHY